MDFVLLGRWACSTQKLEDLDIYILKFSGCLLQDETFLKGGSQIWRHLHFNAKHVRCFWHTAWICCGSFFFGGACAARRLERVPWEECFE